MLTSKHENSVSYDQSLTLAANDKQGCDVLIIVDAISRKYFTSDVSWLWDIDFELLSSKNVGEIVLAGLYSADLQTRFSFTGIEESKIKAFSDIGEATEYLKTSSDRKLYVITCFSDKENSLVLLRRKNYDY